MLFRSGFAQGRMRVDQKDFTAQRRKQIVHLVGISGYLERDMRIAVQRGGELEPRFRRVGEPEVPLFFAANLAAVDVIGCKSRPMNRSMDKTSSNRKRMGGLSLRLTVCNRHMHLAGLPAGEGRAHMGGLQEGGRPNRETSSKTHASCRLTPPPALALPAPPTRRRQCSRVVPLVPSRGLV